MSNNSTCYSTLGSYNSHEAGTVHASAMVVANPNHAIMRIPVFGFATTIAEAWTVPASCEL